MRNITCFCCRQALFLEIRIVKMLDASPKKNYQIGLLLAVVSSFFIGASLVVQKKALLRLSGYHKTKSPEFTDCKKFRDLLWLFGVLIMGFGEALNFVAYAFAPATLITPLGALSVIVTICLSCKFLGEKLNFLVCCGCLTCLLGSTMVVIHCPKEDNVKSTSDLIKSMSSSNFICYSAIVFLGIVLLIIYVSPRYGAKNIFVYISICSLIGSFSVLACKGLAIAFREWLEEKSTLLRPLSLSFLLILAVSIFLQLQYLSKALDVFQVGIVTTIYYAFFTTMVVVAGGLLLKEWSALNIPDYIGFLCGFVNILIGTFLMQAFKDLSITMHSLPNLNFYNWKTNDVHQ
ncbi:Magnesium transporter NIPA2 [Trichinella pseudospiralis]